MTEYERGYHQGKADAMKAQEPTGFMDSKLNPIKRQWVGLTDEDKAGFWTADQMNIEEWDTLFNEIEAVLKEKNA